MKVVFYTNNLSPHQLPLAHAVARRVGYENFVYVGEEIAWRGKVMDCGALRTMRRAEAGDLLETCDILYTGGLRPIDLMERRAAKGLTTFYYSERWFKPIEIGVGSRCRCGISGWLRMMVPGYRRMAKRFVRLANENACVRFLSVGPWAWVDFVKMGVREEALTEWGYFVEPSKLVIGDSCSCRMDDRKSNSTLPLQLSRTTLKVLWVGRMLDWKRVGDIERAIVLANKKLASTLQLQPTTQAISFTKLTGVSLSEIRQAMREHDVYVLASNAEEGWGAALNEALEEGMNALGTFEAGASAAMLPKERLYHAGDVAALARLIEREMRNELPPCSIGDWTAERAAERLLEKIGRI